MNYVGEKADQGYDWAMDKTFDTAENVIMGAVNYVTGVDGRWNMYSFALGMPDLVLPPLFQLM